MAVEPYFAIAEHPVETETYPLAPVCFGESESPAVPSYRGFRIDTACRLETMAQYIFVIAFHKFLLHHPVVGEVQRAPC